jgi:hypothetical protein
MSDKFCVDCKHKYQMECRNPKAYKNRDMVTGELQRETILCKIQRGHNHPLDACGFEGKWFEPKEKTILEIIADKFKTGRR